MGSSITKEDALSNVFNAAKKYHENLINRNLLFICTDKHRHITTLEVSFPASRFYHLTGFVVDENAISQTDFFHRCLNKRLRLDDFEFNPDGTTPLKMQVLPFLFDKHLNAKMIGDYNNRRPKLYTEKLAGNIKGALGFVRNGGVGRYVPNTVLKGDMRDDVNGTLRIIATFRKGLDESAYRELVYLAKEVVLSDYQLPEYVIIE